jgi:hypothetical protein
MKRLFVLVFGFSLCAAGCASAEQSPNQLSTGASTAAETSPAAADVTHAASELSRELAGDARLSSVEVRNGQEILIHWDGPIDSKLRALLDRFPGVHVSVQTTSCSPGKLREYGSRLLASDPAVKVFSIAPDGSTLQLTLDPSLEGSADVASLEHTYSEAAGCPVKVGFGEVVPADR